MVEDWNNSKSEEEFIIMRRNAKLSQLISRIIISLAEATIIAQFIMSVFVIKSYTKENNQYNSLDRNISTTFKPLYFNSAFLYDVQRSPYYEITLIFQFLSTFFAASTFSSIDAFFAVLVLHLCGQLHNLKESLRRLPKESSTKGNEAFLKILSSIVIRHEYLER
jgi:hypothetical protein